MLTEPKIIVKEGEIGKLDGKCVEFLPIPRYGDTLTFVLIRASEVADIGEAVKNAIEEAKRKSMGFPFGVLEMTEPLPHLKHPTNTYLRIIDGIEYYGFDLNLHREVVVQQA